MYYVSTTYCLMHKCIFLTVNKDNLRKGWLLLAKTQVPRYLLFYEGCNGCGGVVVERSPRMREIGVRFPVATDLVLYAT